MSYELPVFDWVVVGLYLFGVLLIGGYASGPQNSTRDYFIGDNRLPWWAVTFSIIATETSAVTFLGLPGLAYRGDWYFLQLVLGFVLGRIFLALFFIKYFYHFHLETVYGFLEIRFGNATRALAALLFLLGRVVASGVRLFAACLAVQVVTGLGITESILISGALGVAYTLLGGIRAVVWTDLILALTFIACGAVTVFCILWRIDGGLTAVLGHSELLEKIRFLHLSPPQGTSWVDFLTSEKGFWVGLLGGFILTLATHGTDQDLVQRMLACEDGRKGSRSLLGSAVLILPVAILFLSIGTLLWFLHRVDPTFLPVVPPSAGGNKEDYYFPLFVVHHLPRGAAGIVFAGLIAAALSSLTSVLNALAATTISDFYRPFIRRDASDRHYLFASRLSTVFWGVVLVAAAWTFIGGQDSILAVAMKALTYFYGSLLGVFLLGIFSRRGNSFSTTLGMFSAVPCVLLLQLRAFLDRPEEAPDFIHRAIISLPESFREWVVVYVPNLGWPLWILVGTAVTFAVGFVGRQTQLSAVSSTRL